MPSLSGWGFARAHNYLHTPLTMFLCPRCRAGLCKGCLWEVSLTCAFAGHRAILVGTDHAGKPFLASEQSLTS